MQRASVVEAGLEKVHAIVADHVNQAVFAGDAPRPDIRTDLLEVLRFANSGKWIAHHGLDQIEDSQCRLSVGIDPPAQIIEALGFDHQRSLFPRLTDPVTRRGHF